MAQEVAAILADMISTESNLQVTPVAKRELLMLKNELIFIKKFISDSAAKRQAAERLRELDLEGAVKEAVCEVEATVQSSTAELEAAKAKNIFLRRFLIPRIGNSLATNLESIRYGRLGRITRCIHAYKINQTPRLETDQQIEEFPVSGSKEIVGFEDEAETLIRSLLAKSEGPSVVAITGMPGIGKTTLAWKIYQDKRVQHEFPTRIWVRWSPKDLWLGIRKQLEKGSIGYQDSAMRLDIPQDPSSSKDSSCLKGMSINGLSDQEIRKTVEQCLKKSRYLLVMDDVSDAASLSSVVELLPETGKVLITSCNNGITEKSHALRFLDEKESWELLQLEVFGKLDECPEYLISTGESIARKCHGSPLAIVAVASSLVVESTSSTVAAATVIQNWWKMVSEDVTKYIKDYGQHHHRVFSRVELSYNQLPQPLKECFLYLGVLPQDHEISVRELIRLWIAEGIVHYHMILTLEELARQNLDDLINRNLVMVGKLYPNGRVETCRLHQLMYGFCRFKAAEQDLYKEIKTCNRPISLTSNCHRLCIYSGLSDFLSTKPKGEFEHVSSILCLNNREEKVLTSHNSAIHKCFKLLEVLECKNISFAEFPQNLTKLVRLRYISLSCDDLVAIPESISSLRYLETLVVNTRSPALDMKANIRKMYKLRHLVSKAAFTLALRGKGLAGTNLHTLTRLAPTCCNEDVFTRTPNLKTLGIRGPLVALSDANSLRKLMFLENLKLMNESAAECRLHHLFQPDCFPPYLERLTISGTCLGWECMAILGKINRLEILKLKNNAFIGQSWSNTNAKAFPSLGFLSIGTTDLASWEASPDCFPRLRRLVLKKCEKLEKIPPTLSKSLDTLDVENVSESAADSAREIEQEIAKRRGTSKGKVA